MRAEEREIRVSFEVSSLDRSTGARVDEKYATYSYQSDKDEGAYLGSLSLAGKTINTYDRDTFLDAVLDFTTNAEAADWTDYTLTVYDNKGRYVTEWKYSSKQFQPTMNDIVVADGYSVEIELLVDGQTAGELYDSKGANPDKIDDRNQAVITVLFQHDVDSSVYDKPNSSSYYVVNKGEDVAKLIEDGTYYNFPGWTDSKSYYYDSKNDVDYIRVYSEPLNKVTADIEVKADWAEDKAGLDRFAPAATNDKDTNGDGKVSCDEYYGTTGLVWSDEKNACVVESNGAVVVTIPNTATK